jgi:hypothetical protein
MKMLYAAERTALREWHRSITGDKFFSMKKGPVLTRTYDLIRRVVPRKNSDMVKWDQFFSVPKNNFFMVKTYPESDFLSQQETEALDQGFDLIGKFVMTNGSIAEDHLHSLWPEWKDPSQLGAASVPIELEDILSEIIEDEDEVKRVASEIAAVNSAKSALQVCA